MDLEEEESSPMIEYNLSDFITSNKANSTSGKETLLISDFEGTTPTAHFNKFREYCETKQVIFLGDVFDNTAQYGEESEEIEINVADLRSKFENNQEDNEEDEEEDENRLSGGKNNYCTGDVCEDPDKKLVCPTDENYCALQTIKLLVDNEERCKYVFGNRDINKIKLLPFFQFTGENENNKWWTNGESYEEIVNNLFDELTKTESPWLVNGADIKYFRPFWKKSKEDYKANRIWTKDEPGNINDIYDRFKLMFGKDASEGTMSALVNLKCIPNEIFPHSGMQQFYKKIVKYKNLSDGGDKKNIKLRIRAALTITVYLRMLDKTLWNGTTEKTHQEFGGLDGYLYYYLTQAPAAYYAMDNRRKNLLLFAHGGITKQFVNSSGNIDIDKYAANDPETWDSTVANEVGANKVGGSGKIQDKIDRYNAKYFEILNSFFDNAFSEEPTSYKKDMLTLLGISAGEKQNPNQVKEPKNDVLNSNEYNEYNVYNIFGHASSSAGYSFGIVKPDKPDDQKRTYYINTDFSTTLYKKGIKCDPQTYNDNYLIAVLHPFHHDTGKVDIRVEGNVILDPRQIRSDHNSYRFNPNVNVLDVLDRNKNKINVEKQKKYDFNGIDTNNNLVFSTVYRSIKTGNQIVNFIPFVNEDAVGGRRFKKRGYSQIKKTKKKQYKRNTRRKQRNTRRKQRNTRRKQRNTRRKQRNTKKK